MRRLFFFLAVSTLALAAPPSKPLTAEKKAPDQALDCGAYLARVSEALRDVVDRLEYFQGSTFAEPNVPSVLSKGQGTRD